MNLCSLRRVFSRDLAIDLGTASTLLFVHGAGIVVDEPSIVVISKTTGEIEAMGKEAKEILDRTPENVVAIRPINEGVIADFKISESMLSSFIQKAHYQSIPAHAPSLIQVSSQNSHMDQNTVRDSACRVHVCEANPVEQAIAVSNGVCLTIVELPDREVGDISGDAAHKAIPRSGIVYSRAGHVAGNEMNRAIVQYVRLKHNLLIGNRTAEQVKIVIGSGYPLDRPVTMEIEGRDSVKRLPKTVTIDDREVRNALAECVGAIRNAIRFAPEGTPPEVSANIIEQSIVLTGVGRISRGGSSAAGRRRNLSNNPPRSTIWL